MKKITTHSKTSLFLMEMLFVLLFLGLACSICVQLFASSYLYRINAREYNHIQELLTSVGEILEGTDGTAEVFDTIFPDGISDGQTLRYYYDKSWTTVSEEEAVYQMTLDFSKTKEKKSVKTDFTRRSSEREWQELYQLTITYPVIPVKEEAP